VRNHSQDSELTPAWQQLTAHAKKSSNLLLRDLVAQDGRFEEFSRELDGLCVDFSRCLATAETLEHLQALAIECNLSEQVAAMCAGEISNTTEKRAALHTALRGTATEMPGVAEQVSVELEKFLAYADSVREGEIVAASGQRFRTVINIGIGGSDLGPRLVARALAGPDEPVQVKFVSGVDGIELAQVLANANPADTLFIVCSKTFMTLETCVNALAAREWLVAGGNEKSVAAQFVAISTNDQAMDEFGIAAERRFRIWDWVGGRYSVWSAVGLAAAIAIGSRQFRAFLAGAKTMDEHFLSAPFVENIPMLLGLLGIWQQNFLDAEASVVLPYDQRLENLPDYLQQLFMESQGKLTTAAGDAAIQPTGKALWGASGSHAQHSFAQWLHQGSANVVVDYVGVVRGPDVQVEQGRMLALANMVAQAEILVAGNTADTQLEPHKTQPGNRPSIMLLLQELDAHSLGMLLALYEHRVFVQAVIWGINPFDQWGVELGKQRASQYADALLNGQGDRLPGIGRRILDWGES
jgi:glucose-6-phosphate isomerase